MSIYLLALPFPFPSLFFSPPFPTFFSLLSLSGYVTVISLSQRHGGVLSLSLSLLCLSFIFRREFANLMPLLSHARPTAGHTGEAKGRASEEEKMSHFTLSFFISVSSPFLFFLSSPSSLSHFGGRESYRVKRFTFCHLLFSFPPFPPTCFLLPSSAISSLSTIPPSSSLSLSPSSLILFPFP